MTIAECAVADDALSCILALLEVATGFAGSHDVMLVREIRRESQREGGEDGWVGFVDDSKGKKKKKKLF